MMKKALQVHWTWPILPDYLLKLVLLPVITLSAPLQAALPPLPVSMSLMEAVTFSMNETGGWSE